MKSVLIWSQASKQIGAGHVHRCYTLAAALKQAEPNTIVSWVAEEATLQSQPWLKKTDIVDHWVSLEELYAKADYDWAIVDDYRCQVEDEAALRTIAKNIMVIDDQPNRQHDSDLLLDQTLGRCSDEYQNRVPVYCKLLTGSQFVLLKPDFQALREKAIEKREKKHGVRQVLVSIGATDPQGLTLKILEKLEESPENFSMKVIVSSSMPNLAAMQSFADTATKSVVLVLDTQAMADKILEADLAIGAAGMTTWERAALGLPSILFQVADNQSDNLQKVEQHRLAEVCSSLALESGQFLQKFHELFSSEKKRSEISSQGFEAVDGLGASRVAQALLMAEAG